MASPWAAATPCPFYPGKRYEDWKVADPHGQGIEKVREVADDIEHRITALESAASTLTPTLTKGRST